MCMQLASFINLLQRCGYSDSPSVRIHDFYTAGFRNGFEGWTPWVHRHKKTVVPKKMYFLQKQMLETSLWDPNFVRDLLKSLMKLTGPATE